jgi:maltokinase
VDGATETFVDVLRHTVTLPAEGFRVVRLVPPPEATGERPVHGDRSDSTIVVGERVVVTWRHQLSDTHTPAPLTCTHLAEVRFLGVPVTYGVLTWRSPDGHELPCAVATGYLPRSRTGRQWCPDLVEQAIGARASAGVSDASGLGPGTGSIPLSTSWVADFPSRIGRLIAKFHIALATPSSVIPDPVHRVDPTALASWHATAITQWRRLEQLRSSGALAHPEELCPPSAELRTAIDRLSVLAAGTTAPSSSTGAPIQILAQRIHGNLHIDQLIRWPGGMAISDTDHDLSTEPEPESPSGKPLCQPTARDLARLLVSLDDVIQITADRYGGDISPALLQWRARARENLLEAYRAELAHQEVTPALDEDLLVAFEAEERCRRLLAPVPDRQSRG